MVVLFSLYLQKMQIFLRISTDLAGSLVRKLPNAFNKFNNNCAKQYYMNIEESCHNFELCNAMLDTIKYISACLDASTAPGLDGISAKLLKDGIAVLALSLSNVILSIKQSLFSDQCKIAKLKPLLKKKALTVTRKITGPPHCYLLCLR